MSVWCPLLHAGSLLVTNITHPKTSFWGTCWFLKQNSNLDIFFYILHRFSFKMISRFFLPLLSHWPVFRTVTHMYTPHVCFWTLSFSQKSACTSYEYCTEMSKICILCLSLSHYLFHLSELCWNTWSSAQQKKTLSRTACSAPTNMVSRRTDTI